jgi:hypothetical protein
VKKSFWVVTTGLFFLIGCGGSGSGLSATSSQALAVAPLSKPVAQTPVSATSLPTAIATSLPTAKATAPPVTATSLPTSSPASVPTIAPAKVPTPAPVVVRLPSGGFVTNWGLELSPAQACAADLSAAVAVHATVIRVQYLPAQQPKRCFDATFAAARSAGFRIVWITPGVNLNAPIDDSAYAQTMATAAAMYPGGVWEIMNEPDVVQPALQVDWPNEQLAANEYVLLAQATANAIHAADKSATVVSGGPSGIEVSTRSLPWLHATVNLAPLIDGVGFHPYAGYDTAQFTSVQDLYNKPVYVTEWQTSDGGIIEGVLDAFNGKVPVFVYCSQACAASSATPTFP